MEQVKKLEKAIENFKLIIEKAKKLKTAEKK